MSQNENKKLRLIQIFALVILIIPFLVACGNNENSRVLDSSSQQNANSSNTGEDQNITEDNQGITTNDGSETEVTETQTETETGTSTTTYTVEEPDFVSKSCEQIISPVDCELNSNNPLINFTVITKFYSVKVPANAATKACLLELDLNNYLKVNSDVKTISFTGQGGICEFVDHQVCLKYDYTAPLTCLEWEYYTRLECELESVSECNVDKI